MEVNTLYIILGVFQMFFVASFMLSVRAAFQAHLPTYLRCFFIYPGVALLMIFLFWLDFFKVLRSGVFADLNFFSLSFHFIFLTWFILQVIKESGNYKIERTTRFVFTIVVVVCIIYDYVHRLNTSYIVVNGLLFLYCLFYFAHLFKNQPHLQLLTSRHEFWIITGIFFGMGIILPFYIFHDFLSARVSSNTINLLRLIGGVGYATMHLFFVKGFSSNINPIVNLQERPNVKTTLLLLTVSLSVINKNSMNMYDY